MVVVLLLAAGAAWESPALGLLSGRGDLVVLKRCVDVDDLLATASAGQADVAVVALEAPGFDIAAVDHLRRHGVRVVALAPGGPRLEAGRVRASRVGVRSVVGDDALDELAAAVTATQSAPPDDGPDPLHPLDPIEAAGQGNGRVIAVWGPAGAPGRTTVATALAAAMSRGGRRTILVDADPYGGSVAQVLGILDEVSGLLSAARLAGAGQLEERFASVQRAVDPAFTVVTGLPRPDRWTEVRAGTLEVLLETAAAHGNVVVDTGFSLEQDLSGDLGGRPGRNQMTLAALEVADEVLVVGNADPVGLSRLARALVDLRETAGTVPVRVVVNRMRPTLGWSERDVAEMVTGFTRPLGLHFLPEDRGTVDRALVTGRALHETNAESPLVVAVDGLVEALVPGARGVRAPRRRFRQQRLRAAASGGEQ